MVLMYIDPGTGSMLFAILLGILGALQYVIRMAIIKIKFVFGAGKVEVADERISYVIFSDHKRYWNVFEPICREFDRRGINVVYMTASEDDPGLECSYEHVQGQYLGEGNKPYAKLNFLKADVVISTTPGLDVYQWKRSKDVKCYVHVLHAAGEVLLYRMFGIDYYDAILLGGEFQKTDIRKLEEIRHLPAKDLAITGIPYMDDMVNRLHDAGPVEKYEKTVLLAPSWGPNGIFSKFGGDIIQKLLDTGYHIIVRPHPQSFVSEKSLIEQIMKNYPTSEQLEWNRDNDNFEVMRHSDILVSDFSGIIFDFALVYDKPVIYTDTRFERDVYDAWWVDGEIWYERALPRIGEELTQEHISEVKKLIDRCLSEEKYAQGRQQVREETWQCYGQGAEMTVDWLVKKHDELKVQEDEK